MPQGYEESVPNRSLPEFSGRPLTIDEKKEDVIRLRDTARALRTHGIRRLDGLNDKDMRETLQLEINIFAMQIDETADRLVSEIRRETFARTGDKENRRYIR